MFDDFAHPHQHKSIGCSQRHSRSDDDASFPPWRWGQGQGWEGRAVTFTSHQPIRSPAGCIVWVCRAHVIVIYDTHTNSTACLKADHVFGRMGGKTNDPICPFDLVNTFYIEFGECSSSLSWGARKERDEWMFGGYKGRQRAGIGQ